MNETALIKAFITKCISSIKYRYYAKKESKNGFESESREIEEIANNEMHHAFALLDRLGFGDDIDFLEDMENDEKKQMECIIEQEGLNYICDIDKNHLQRLAKLKEERNSESAYKTKKCALCGYTDRSGKIIKKCPFCNNTVFTTH